MSPISVNNYFCISIFKDVMSFHVLPSKKPSSNSLSLAYKIMKLQNFLNVIRNCAYDVLSNLNTVVSSVCSKGCLYAAHSTEGGEQDGIRQTLDMQIEAWGGGSVCLSFLPNNNGIFIIPENWGASLVAQTLKNPPSVQEMQV